MRKCRLLLLLLLSIVSNLMSCAAGTQDSSVHEVTTLAQTYGLSPEDHVAIFQNCADAWPPFSRGNCRTIGIYRTSLGLEDFRRQFITHRDTSFTQREIDGFSIFTYLNVHTSQGLRADGKDGMGDTRLTMHEPQAVGWQVDTLPNSELSINFYALRGDTVTYTLNGEVLKYNLVILMLATVP